VNVGYVVKRFPKFSETFVLHELQELERQGDRVSVFSLTRPYAGHPLHRGALDLMGRTCYLPRGPARLVALVAAAFRELIARPQTTWSAFLWSLRWTLHERNFDHMKRFGEACYLRGLLPRDLDHLHAHFAHGPATVALLLARLTGLPFSFTAHAKDIFQLVRPELLRAKAAEAHFVVTVSDYTHDHVLQSLASADRSKVVVVRNGIDPAHFAPRGREPNGVPVALAVSRLVAKKGLDTLLEACALLTNLGLDIRCEVIGDGPRRAKLEQQAQRLGLVERVDFAGGRDDDTVRHAYDQAAVFVLPCRRTSKGDQDGLPVSIVEALSVGVPVVTTPVSGIPEVVHDGVSGLLVPPDDPTALAAAIERVLSDVGLRQRLVEGGRAQVRAYDLESSVKSLRRHFRLGPHAT
jgi:glycosyltransferase involved in cell wall biosynthesis